MAPLRVQTTILPPLADSFAPTIACVPPTEDRSAVRRDESLVLSNISSIGREEPRNHSGSL